MEKRLRRLTVPEAAASYHCLAAHAELTQVVCGVSWRRSCNQVHLFLQRLESSPGFVDIGHVPLPGHRLNRRPQLVCLDRSTCRDLRSLDHANAPVQHGQDDLVLRPTVAGDTGRALLGILAEKLAERSAALGRFTEFCFHIIVVISDLPHVCCPVLCHVDFCNRSSRLMDDFSHQILVHADRAPEQSTAHQTSIMAERLPGATTSNTPGPRHLFEDSCVHQRVLQRKVF